jgi:hypothetical protein
MMLKASAAIALMITIAIPVSATAGGRRVDAVRHGVHVDAGDGYHAKRPVRSSRSWTGVAADRAGNSYVYVKPGAGSPFGPLRTLR